MPHLPHALMGVQFRDMYLICHVSLGSSCVGSSCGLLCEQSSRAAAADQVMAACGQVARCQQLGSLE